MNFVFVKTWQISAQQCFRCIRMMYVGSMEDVSLTVRLWSQSKILFFVSAEFFFLFHCQFFPCSVHLYQLFVSTFCLLGTEDKLITNGVCQTTSAMLAAILNKYFLLLPDPVCGYYGLALKIAPKALTDKLCVTHVCKKFVLTLFGITSKS